MNLKYLVYKRRCIIKLTGISNMKNHIRYPFFHPLFTVYHEFLLPLNLVDEYKHSKIRQRSIQKDNEKSWIACGRLWLWEVTLVLPLLHLISSFFMSFVFFKVPFFVYLVSKEMYEVTNQIKMTSIISQSKLSSKRKPVRKRVYSYS